MSGRPRPAGRQGVGRCADAETNVVVVAKQLPVESQLVLVVEFDAENHRLNRHLDRADVDFVDDLVAKKVIGGQHHDGSQKDGILKYEKGRPVAVYEPNKVDYVAFASGLAEKADAELGSLPEGYRPWKALLADRGKKSVLESHFAALRESATEGARLAMDYLRASKAIGERLVSDGVANNPDDVNGVLTNGFYHLYGPINDYTG